MTKNVEKFNYIDKIVDIYFDINTLSNASDTKKSNNQFYNYLPTIYAYFEELFTKYPFELTDCFVDIGCGKGRTSLMDALFGAKRLCGIEINKLIFMN